MQHGDRVCLRSLPFRACRRAEHLHSCVLPEFGRRHRNVFFLAYHPKTCWTADRLQRECDGLIIEISHLPLGPESPAHLLFPYRVASNIWSMVRDWVGLVSFEPVELSTLNDVKSLWLLIVHAHHRRKVMSSFVMMVLWNCGMSVMLEFQE